MHDPSSTASPSPLSAGLRSCCPRCGHGRLFDGFLKLAPRCNVCGLDYSFADPADGPAFFVMMIMAWPITAFGVWIELAYSPPLWVHFVTAVPPDRQHPAPALLQGLARRKPVRAQGRGGAPRRAELPPAGFGPFVRAWSEARV